MRSKLIVIFCSIAISLNFWCLIFLVTSTPVLADINIDNGAQVFRTNCAGCHAHGGNIVRRGKNLKLKALRKNKVNTQQAIATLVTNGKGNMSAYQDKLTSQEIAEVSAYVLQRAKENWRK